MIPAHRGKIYVAAPPAIASGGPELLHQLAAKLRSIGLNAVMHYCPAHPDPVSADFLHYDVPHELHLEDAKNNVLVAPETLATMLSQVSRIRTVLWWLSFDNYFLMKIPSGRAQRLVADVGLVGLLARLSTLRPPKVNLHLAQSYYAAQMLSKSGFSNRAILSDYLNPGFFARPADTEGRRDIVVYNPSKGLRVTRQIIRRSRGIEFVPICNMSRDEVVSLLRTAKVYIDFGSHPGKDRIPREAAISGCCVITNKRGSAAFSQDVPIPDLYKFDDRFFFQPGRVVSLISSCLRNYQEHLSDFEVYRQQIAREELEFEREVREIFLGDGNPPRPG
ncbi:MAG: hypothetical protein Cons2KO_29510 [Congregibacter sp.]